MLPNYKATICTLCLSLPTLVFAASTNVPSSFIAIEAGHDTPNYNDYSSYIDTQSIKPVSNDSVVFNMIVYGLELSRDNLEGQGATNHDYSSDFVDMSRSQLVVTSQANCSTQEIKPIQFTSYNRATALKEVSTPEPQDHTTPSTPAEIEINKKVIGIVCKS